MRSQVYLKKKPRKLKVAIVGFPGVGMLGFSTVKLLVKELKAEKIGEILCPNFPHQAYMTKTGMLRATKIILYRYKEVLFVIGDAQPQGNEGQYELAYTLVELFQKLKIQEIVTIGGYVAKENLGEIYLVGNNQKLIRDWLVKHLGIVGKAKGFIVGMAGLVPVVAKHYKIPAITLLVTTPADAVLYISGMRIAAEVLAKRFNFKIDFERIDKKIEKTQKVIERVKSEVESKEKESVSPYIR